VLTDHRGSVKVIGIKADSRDRGEFVLEALKTAVEQQRVSLDDLALVTRDGEGNVEIHQTKDVTPKRAAGKGALVGALVGLAAPPLLGAAAVGAGIGAVWGKFRDRGVDDDVMKRVGGMIADGEAVVFALGDDASIDAIAGHVREVTGGDMETFVINHDDEAVVREVAVHVPEPSGLSIRMPYS
jgi:uncharacterized membrane protein